MAAKDCAATRFSALEQITMVNAHALVRAWTFSTDGLRGREAAPIVADGALFIVTPCPNLVYALDLTAPGAPIKWKYSPNPAASAQGVARCDLVNRGAVYSSGTLYFNTLDNDAIALDAQNGRIAWRAYSPGPARQAVVPSRIHARPARNLERSM